jgi:hypothetical protein
MCQNYKVARYGLQSFRIMLHKVRMSFQTTVEGNRLWDSLKIEYKHGIEITAHASVMHAYSTCTLYL